MVYDGGASEGRTPAPFHGGTMAGAVFFLKFRSFSEHLYFALCLIRASPEPSTKAGPPRRGGPGWEAAERRNPVLRWGRSTDDNPGGSREVCGAGRRWR